ncbi:mitochondrial Homoaconitase [Neonectria punicea]|uniref:Mitochondrial Homoaconitase n=1 Tax=Neonectria punicea TaxID=979145 RepID=A0ABR1GUT0_9HYPO
MSPNTVAALSLPSRISIARSRFATATVTRFRSHPSAPQRRHYAFHSQLENLPTADTLRASQAPATPAKPQTLVEKIVQKYADGLAPGKIVRAGDYVTLRPHKSMTHDNSAAAIEKFLSKKMGGTKVNDPSQM